MHTLRFGFDDSITNILSITISRPPPPPFATSGKITSNVLGRRPPHSPSPHPPFLIKKTCFKYYPLRFEQRFILLNDLSSNTINIEALMATYPLLKLMERDSILYTILTFGGVNTFDMFFELCQLGTRSCDCVAYTKSMVALRLIIAPQTRTTIFYSHIMLPTAFWRPVIKYIYQ